MPEMKTDTMADAMAELLHGPDLRPDQMRVHEITKRQPSRNLARFDWQCSCGAGNFATQNEAETDRAIRAHLATFDACTTCGTVSGPHAPGCAGGAVRAAQPAACPTCGAGARVPWHHPLVVAADAFLESLNELLAGMGVQS